MPEQHAYVRYSAEVETQLPDEDDVIGKIIASMTRESETTAGRYNHAVRASHAKSTGLLKGELRVLPGLPTFLRQGLFAEPRSHPVVVRLAQGPVPRGSKGGWMANAEYPADALEAGEEGAVTVALAIDASGGVAGCDVVKSSGSRSLDAETCRAVRRRARYTPATDDRGQAVASADRHTVRWALPK